MDFGNGLLWSRCLPFAGLKSAQRSHMQSEKTNLCREEMRPWPRLAKALKCGSALERFSRAGIMQSLQSRPPGQLRNEKASWSKTPWFEQGLRPNPSYWTYDPYDLELELYPENCETRHSSSCVNSFGLHASVRPYSLSRSNQVCKKSYSVISRARTPGARVTNVITHASRVKWSQDRPRLISFQKLEREHRSFSASVYQFTPGRMAIVHEMMTLFSQTRIGLCSK